MISLLKHLFGIKTSDDPIILFDHQKQKKLYLERCKPVLNKMLETGLIKKLFECEKYEDFGNTKFFTQNDFEHILYAKPILEKILLKPEEIEINSNDDLEMIVKLMMKKYLLELDTITEYKTKKVSIQVQVLLNGNIKQIQVISYNNKLKDPGGNIEDNEEPIEAAIREIEEELGLLINSDRLELLEIQNQRIYKYILKLNEEEYNKYISNISLLQIDPEITMIALI